MYKAALSYWEGFFSKHGSLLVTICDKNARLVRAYSDATIQLSDAADELNPAMGIVPKADHEQLYRNCEHVRRGKDQSTEHSAPASYYLKILRGKNAAFVDELLERYGDDPGQAFGG